MKKIFFVVMLLCAVGSVRGMMGKPHCDPSGKETKYTKENTEAAHLALETGRTPGYDRDGNKITDTVKCKPWFVGGLFVCVAVILYFKLFTQKR